MLGLHSRRCDRDQEETADVLLTLLLQSVKVFRLSVSRVPLLTREKLVLDTVTSERCS